MTDQSGFKRRVRERMAKTGERYAAARRTLLQSASTDPRPSASRTWVSTPEVDDQTVRAATGRTWDEWCDIIDAWPDRERGHAAIARHLAATYGLNSWWSQGVTIGWERITGQRLVHQRTDGSFSAGVTRTIRIDLGLLRSMIVDDEERRHLFPSMPTTLRSRPTSKALRVGIDQNGSALFSFQEKPAGRVSINVSHDELTSPEDVQLWKDHWRAWLEALDEDTASRD